MDMGIYLPSGAAVNISINRIFLQQLLQASLNGASIRQWIVFVEIKPALAVLAISGSTVDEPNMTAGREAPQCG
jgi:hypothetical protein